MLRFLFLFLLGCTSLSVAQDSTQVLLEKLLSKSFGEKIKGTVYESRIEYIRKKITANKVLSSKIDSLTTVVAKSKFSSADSILFSTILKSAVNDSSGDTYSSVRKIPSEKALALNRLYTLSKLYEIDRKYSTNMKELKPFIWFENSDATNDTIEKYWRGKPVPNCLEEIRKMKLRPGSTIADIGAGTGVFEFSLEKSLDSLVVYATEVDTALYNVLSNELLKIQLNNSTSNKYYPIYGSSKKTNLPDRTFDAIVIRNTFHHFDHPNEMLQDIKLKLKKNGSLYIVDVFSDETTKPPACSKHLTRAVFAQYLGSNGFKQTEEIILPGRDFKILVFE